MKYEHDLDPRRIDEREWQAQERALRGEQRGCMSGDGGPLVARYRQVVSALRQPIAEGLPVDFAQRVAQRVSRQAGHRMAIDLRLERNLMRGLVAALALSGAVALAWHGQAAWQSLLALIPPAQGAGIGWGPPLAACIALSWSLEALRKAIVMQRGARNAA